MIFKNVISTAPENNNQLFNNYTIDSMYVIHYNNRNKSIISYLGGSDVVAIIIVLWLFDILMNAKQTKCIVYCICKNIDIAAAVLSSPSHRRRIHLLRSRLGGGDSNIFKHTPEFLKLWVETHWSVMSKFLVDHENFFWFI